MMAVSNPRFISRRMVNSISPPQFAQLLDGAQCSRRRIRIEKLARLGARRQAAAA